MTFLLLPGIKGLNATLFQGDIQVPLFKESRFMATFNQKTDFVNSFFA